MATATTETKTATSGSDRKPANKPTAPWVKTLRTYAGVAVIVIWGLGPFYWMAVTAFRDLQFTYDTTPWPTHVTWDNFQTVFSTSRGNHFGQALVNSVII
ncbi:MAG TPA: carbohydrate ABC transporter permease, partial [Nocardioides sp.]|nr:carbohydrate ABC transporter permease [Nocardioides sp.]